MGKRRKIKVVMKRLKLVIVLFILMCIYDIYSYIKLGMTPVIFFPIVSIICLSIALYELKDINI